MASSMNIPSARMWHACAVAWLSAVTLARADQPADASAAPQPLAVITQVSDRFRREIEDATGAVPGHVWRRVRRSGWRVGVAEFVVDAAPGLSGVHPRGWPRQATWDNTDAIHLPHSRLLVLAEKRRTYAGQVVDTNRAAGVLRHELGHAFDMTSGGRYRFRSSVPQFVARYRRDVAALDAGQQRELAYYLQSRSAGRQEAFAEAFAIVLGGGSDVTRRPEFERGFPEVMDYLREALAAEPP